MSFKVSDVEYSPFLRDEVNQLISKWTQTVVPTEKYISDLPLPKNLNLEPCSILRHQVKYLEAILEFDVQPNDVFVCSIIKCGSSWTQTIVWLLTHNLNYRNAVRNIKMATFDNQFVMQAAENKIRHLLNDDVNHLDELTFRKMVLNEHCSMESPLVVKTHLPIHFLPKATWSKKAKVIYVVRNPKDSAVSEYHYVRNYAQEDSLTIDDFVDGTTNDKWQFCPRFAHILNFWKCRYMPNVLIVAYEDLVNDSFATIKKISEFLECKYSDDQLKELTEYVSFENMKKNPDLNREDDIKFTEQYFNKKRPDPEFTFLRKGKSGTYHDEMTEAQIKKFDDWIEKNRTDTDFRFKM